VTMQSSGEISREAAEVRLRGRRMGRALAKPIMPLPAQKIDGFRFALPILRSGSQ